MEYLTLKFGFASQARTIYKYRNIRRKILDCNTNSSFNHTSFYRLLFT